MIVKRQNKIMIKLGPVQIRTGGWFIKKETAKKYAMSEKLLNFLNVDIENEYDVEKYCKDNGYVPLDLSEGWIEGFKREQQPVKEIAIKIVRGKITNNDIEEIANRLRNVVMKIRVLSEAQLEQLNEDLYQLKKDKEYYKVIDYDGENKYLIYVPYYSTSVETMWGCIYSTLKSNRPLKMCRDTFRCRRFFIPNSKSPNQQFCTPECENRFNHRVTYNKKPILRK